MTTRDQDPQIVSINSVAAPHMAASTIWGAADSLILSTPGWVCPIPAGRPYTELRWSAEDLSSNGATITIERPGLGDGLYTVSHSSSSSYGTLADIRMTAKVLVFAIAVVDILNGWTEA